MEVCNSPAATNGNAKNSVLKQKENPLVSLELSGHVHKRHGEARIPDVCACAWKSTKYQSKLLLDPFANPRNRRNNCLFVSVGLEDTAAFFFLLGKGPPLVCCQGKLQARYRRYGREAACENNLLIFPSVFLKFSHVASTYVRR